ncbi:unnamed protein product, partial [Symbiodinium microadriaticum]
CCFLYSLLKPAEWYKNKGITGFWELAGLTPAPVPAQSFKDVLMAPTLIGMFQSGKFLPPQLNLVLELEFAEPADALRPGGGSTDYAIENVRVLASQVTLDSALYESYQKILLSGRSLVFAYPTMHTQVSSIPAGSTAHNVTVARAFTKLLGAFVSFRDIDDALGECSNFEHPGDGSQFSTSALESQMQLGSLQYPRYPMASDAEHFHFLEILAGTYDSSIKNMRIADNLWNNTQFIAAFPVERVPKHPLSGISTRSGDLARFSFKNMQADRVQRMYIHLLSYQIVTVSVLDDGQTPPPVIELQGISAGQLSLVLTQYTPLETTTQNTADIGVNAAAIAALQGQVAALPAAPDLAPYALASDLAAAEGSIAANASGLVAVNTSLTQGLATKANQSALDALQVEVNGKSTPASVDLKLANHPTTAAMNSSIASANNATLATVATTYALKSVVDQLALDVAARQTAADVDQRVATALLSYLTQTAYQAGQALQDARLDGHDADILALQNGGPFATGAELTALQVSLQSAIDGILAEIATLGGATNLVNAPAWQGEITWDLLVGTNQVRNLHAVAPLSIALANDNWTLSLSCDAYSRAEADALLLPKASESWVLAQLGGYYTTQQADDAIAAALTNHFTRAEVTANLVAFLAQANTYTDDQLGDYSTTAEMTQAIADALVPYGTIVQRDAAIAAALTAYYTSAQTDSAIAAAVGTIDLTPYWTIAQVQAAITAALVPVTLANGQNWNGGPTFNLLRGTNVLRNLSVAGALTASFQNLDYTILIESDSYARSETYTQLETGAAITAAIDALDLSQFRNEAQVLALIAGELGPYWDQTEVANYVGGQLSNYQTSSQVSSAISSALSSYDNSNEVDSKIVTALLDFYTRSEVDQEIADALSNVDLSAYYTSAQTDSLFYPRSELDSLLTATLLQYWTSGRTQSEIDDALAGSGFLDQAAGDARYLVRPPGAASGSIHQIVQNQFFPPIIKNLLLQPPLAGASILGNGSTLQITCDCYSKSESDSRYLSTSDFAPLDARYFVREPFPEGNGIFSMVQEAFTPRIIRSLLCQSPLSAQPILGNGSTLQISCDCWSKGQSDGRYPLIANFNSLGSTVTSIDNRLTTLENSGGIAPTADLTVNSIQNALVTVRKEDGALLASFADGGISLDRDITVAAASTLNATTADITQLTVGSTAATGTFSSNSSVTANLEI